MTLELNKTHCMNCLDGMKLLPDNYVDLTVTSPPYDDLRTYNGYSFDFENIAKELYRVTKDGGVVVWVVGDKTKNGSESGTSFKQALYFKEIGFNLHDTMIYEKAQCCFGSNKAYLQSFEYMFVLSKGRPKTINLIYDRENVRHGIESATSGGMKKDGTIPPRKDVELKKLGRRKNIWKYGVGGGKTGHPAVFPEQLANDHIISWSSEGDVVMDIFSGSGTTHNMALLNNRNFIGFEISQEYIDIENERIKQLNMGL